MLLIVPAMVAASAVPAPPAVQVDLRLDFAAALRRVGAPAVTPEPLPDAPVARSPWTDGPTPFHVLLAIAEPAPSDHVLATAGPAAPLIESVNPDFAAPSLDDLAGLPVRLPFWLRISIDPHCLPE